MSGDKSQVISLGSWVKGQKSGQKSSQRSQVDEAVGQRSKVRDPRSEVGSEFQSKVVS